MKVNVIDVKMRDNRKREFKRVNTPLNLGTEGGEILKISAKFQVWQLRKLVQ